MDTHLNSLIYRGQPAKLVGLSTTQISSLAKAGKIPGLQSFKAGRYTQYFPAIFNSQLAQWVSDKRRERSEFLRRARRERAYQLRERHGKRVRRTLGSKALRNAIDTIAMELQRGVDKTKSYQHLYEMHVRLLPLAKMYHEILHHIEESGDSYLIEKRKRDWREVMKQPSYLIKRD